MADLEASAVNIIKFRVGHPFEISFTLQNMTSKVIPKDTIIIHIPQQGTNNAILRCITPIDQAISPYAEIVCVAKVKVGGANLHFRHYPLALAVEIKRDAKVLYSFSIMLSASLVANNVKELKLPSSKNKLHILVFGEFGAGKTSLMLTILSALKGQLVMAHPQLGVIGGGAGHASTTFRRIDITQNISFLDSWGCSPTNYASDEFKQIVTGMFPVGTDMSTRLKYNELNGHAAADKQQPDAVFFFITQALVEDFAYIERLKKFKEILKRERPEINPYIILSKIDEIDTQLRAKPDGDNDLVKDKIIRIAAETGVPEMHIFPILSYKIEKESSEVIDRFAMDLLNVAIRSAADLHHFEW